MPIRRIAEEPASRLAIWARRIASFSLPVALLAILIARAGLLEIVPVLATLAASLAMAAIAILLALASLIGIWRHGSEGLGAALTAILISGALLAYPSYLMARAARLPEISDITTDPIDPPRYETIGRLRSRDANPIAYAGLYAAQQQKAAYPDVVPLETDASAPATYDAAMAVIAKRRWQVINARAPAAAQGGQPARDGYIEAVARTLIMGFRDDVAVRIRAVGDGTRVDVRSSSRYGRHDFGANAARVRALLDDIEDLAGQDKPDVPEHPVPKVKQPPPQKPDQKPAQKPKR
jgi:uncharacterized protein (DUF1499 family)